MGLYQKHRPTEWSEIIGNENLVSVLESIPDKKEHPHVFLFSGETGCGKTTMARILAEKLGIKGMDLKEYNGSETRGIDAVRAIINQSSLSPIEGKARGFIIDECHQLTVDAQNALLKPTEDIASHLYFFFCTTEPNKMLAALKNRCSQYTVNLLTDKEMRRLLRGIVEAEEKSLSKEVYNQIIIDAMGHPRQALTVLEQVLLLEDEEAQLAMAKKKAEEYNEAIELCRALLSKKPWKSVAEILRGLKDQDPEKIRRVVLGYCQSVLLGGQTNNQAGLIMECFIEPFYNTGFPGLTFACYSVITNN